MRAGKLKSLNGMLHMNGGHLLITQIKQTERTLQMIGSEFHARLMFNMG